MSEPTSAAEKDRMRGVGGNRFIEHDATRADLMRSINDQLGDLQEWAAWTGRGLDLGEITISTQRISSGRISVNVSADLTSFATRHEFVLRSVHGYDCACGWSGRYSREVGFDTAASQHRQHVADLSSPPAKATRDADA